MSLAVPLAGWEDMVLLFVRVLVGVVFLYYGLPKVRDLRANAKDFVGMGFKPGGLWGTVVALQETVGSVGLLLGIYPALWAAGFVIHMTVGTIWKISKTDKPFTDWSYDLVLLALALVVLAVGPGGYVLFS